MSTTYDITLGGVDYRVVVFGTESWTVPDHLLAVDVLVVGGGGSGAFSNNGGGGGGAGGCRWLTGQAVTPGDSISVVKGAGGATQSTANFTNGNDGANSSFGAITSIGGAGGQALSTALSTGGSGGGGAPGGAAGANGNPSAGTAGQGSGGGFGFGAVVGSVNNRCGGGGGGKGAAGGNASAVKGGDGGTGFDASALLGTSVGSAGWFASGGGGGARNDGVFGADHGVGTHGGGSGGEGNVVAKAATAGAASTGSGGGGGGGNAPNAGNGLAGAAGGSGFVAARYILPASAPGVPTAVAGVPVGTFEVDLSWTAPASGGAVSEYEVRIDGGAAVSVGLSLAHAFTGLPSGATYTVGVRATNVVGVSSWVEVDVVVPDDFPTPEGYYRVALTIGEHEWTIERGDAPAYGPLLPISLGWDIPDGEYFPVQSSLQTLNLRIQTHDASELADVVKGTEVEFAVYLDADPDPDIEPWQWFSGVVTQLDGEFVPGQTDVDSLDYRVTVYAADDTVRLADMVVGYANDWPIESIYDRCERICTEAGIGFSAGPFIGSGMAGWLSARSKGSPVSVLDALRASLKDAADEYDSEAPPIYYGRYVYRYDKIDEGVTFYAFRRRVFETITLDGGKVRAEGSWTKQPGAHMATWGVVDDTTYGTPDGSPPFYVSTSLLDYFGDPPGSELNGSAETRDNLGRSLLADGSTALDGWSTRSLRYLSYLDPLPVTFWASYTGASHLMSTPFGGTDIPTCMPVVCTPVGDELEVNGVDYVAGTLTGARLVIPPGGNHYVEFRLRAELLPGTDLP